MNFFEADSDKHTTALVEYINYIEEALPDFVINEPEIDFSDTPKYNLLNSFSIIKMAKSAEEDTDEELDDDEFDEEFEDDFDEDEDIDEDDEFDEDFDEGEDDFEEEFVEDDFDSFDEEEDLDEEEVIWEIINLKK